MLRPKKTIPEYQSHFIGQARVYLDGRYFYLGPYDSPQSKARYAELLGIYTANNQTVPDDQPACQVKAPVSVAVVTAEFREAIKDKYANSPDEGRRYRNLCTLLEDEHGDSPADWPAPFIRYHIWSENPDGCIT